MMTTNLEEVKGLIERIENPKINLIGKGDLLNILREKVEFIGYGNLDVESAYHIAHYENEFGENVSNIRLVGKIIVAGFSSLSFSSKYPGGGNLHDHYSTQDLSEENVFDLNDK